jgi:hypothetical protein
MHLNIKVRHHHWFIIYILEVPLQNHPFVNIASFCGNLITVANFKVRYSYWWRLFCEFFSMNSVDLGKLGSHYGLGGNQRIAIQLLRQLDGIKLYLICKTPLPFPFQPWPHRGSMSPPQCASPWVNSLQGHIIILKTWIVCTLHFESYPMG